MAVIAPNSEIYLIKCPIELDNMNQLSFANATAQHNYFNSLPKLSLTNATFQRKDGTIRWPGSMEDILEYNYCMYRNKNHGNKWFYAFIDRMMYVTDNMTAIKISTDVWNTWQFNVQWHASYVEREHVNDDTVGLHTIPEGLETGDFVCNDIVEFRYADTVSVPITSSNFTMYIVMQVTSLVVKYTTTHSPEGWLDGVNENFVNGVPQGLYILGFPLSKDGVTDFYSLKGAYDGAGRGDAIVSCFVLPVQSTTAWLPYSAHGTISDLNNKILYPADSTGYSQVGNIDDNANLNFSIDINTTLDGYTPRNGKCKVAPYNYFTITNNDGSIVSFNYEDFLSTPNFKVISSFEQGGTFMCQPSNSKRSTNTNDNLNGWIEGIPGAKFPQLSWTSDYYLNWQAQNGKYLQITDTLNAINFGSNLLSSLMGGYGSSMMSTTSAGNTLYGTMSPDLAEARVRNLTQTMDVGGATTSGSGALGAITDYAGSIASSMQQRRVASLTPDQAKGNGSTGSLSYATNSAGRFTARKMSCKSEYIKAIDSYFDMYGYKVNSLKVPNVYGRANWNYVKTIGCNITGDIPQEDLQTIKAMFNTGVTIWHNPATFLDYSQNNNIV